MPQTTQVSENMMDRLNEKCVSIPTTILYELSRSNSYFPSLHLSGCVHLKGACHFFLSFALDYGIIWQGSAT